MRVSSTVFIVDTYNKYARNKNVCYVFHIHDNWYCIREVELNWGNPIFPEKPFDETNYYLYNTYEEAITYVKTLKRVNKEL